MKKIIVLMAFALLNLSAFAQNETVVSVSSKYGPYITNKIFDNWFVSVGGGAQMYFSAYDRHLDFGKRIAPALDVAVGKWITPSIGMRLEYSGLSAKALTPGPNPYTSGTFSGSIVEQKFNTMNLHADAMWNISNAIGGYMPDRLWDFIPYVGLGWTRSNENSRHNDEIAANVGLLHNIRITDMFDVSIDMRAMVVNQDFSYETSKSGVTALGTITAGITYNIGVNTFRRASDLMVVEDNSGYINEISGLKTLLAAAQQKRIALEKALQAEQAKEAKVVKEMYPVLPDMAVFFDLNSAKITNKGMVNIGYIADVIKQVPDKKFTLFASADKETGTPEYNMALSQRRGDAVCKALVEKFGVNPDQIHVKAVGSAEQKFEGEQLNRVVVIEDQK